MQVGRPKEIDRTGREAGDIVLTFRVTRSQKERIKRIADGLGLTVGQYVRKQLIQDK